MEGFISDVNRSNKRINFAVTLMDRKRILSLSDQEIQKSKISIAHNLNIDSLK